jgi:hypothetical protein
MRGTKVVQWAGLGLACGWVVACAEDGRRDDPFASGPSSVSVGTSLGSGPSDGT